MDIDDDDPLYYYIHYTSIHESECDDEHMYPYTINFNWIFQKF